MPPFDQPDPTQGSAADSSSSSGGSPLQRLLAVPEWEHKELIHSVAQLAPSLIATVLEKHAQRKESRSLKRLPKDVLGCVVEYLVRPGEAGVEDVALLAGVSKRFRACVQVPRLMGNLKIRTFERFGKLGDDKQKSVRWRRCFGKRFCSTQDSAQSTWVATRYFVRMWQCSLAAACVFFSLFETAERCML